MSYEAKVRFIDEVKGKLADKFTMSEVENILLIMQTAMNDFDVDDCKEYIYGEDDFLETFISALNIEGRSKKTLNRYRYIIGRMLKSVKIHTANISVGDLRSYLNQEKNRGISDRTMEGERQIFSSYFGWLHREGMIAKNPAANIGIIKHRKKIKDVFSDVDVELMKKACGNPRDIALVTFLLSTGCRVSEVIQTNRNDVDFNALEVKVLGKGNKERIVYLDQVSGMLLKSYLDGRKDDDECLFRSRLGNRISDETIRKLLKNIERKSGVKNIHPHKFRRTLATNLIRRGMPIEKVKTILGHENINTTMQYIVLDQNDVKYSYQKVA